MPARNKLTFDQALPQYDRTIPPCDGLSRRSEIASYWHGVPEWGCFREVAMDQIYLTFTVSSLTLLVSAYVLGVALV